MSVSTTRPVFHCPHSPKDFDNGVRTSYPHFIVSCMLMTACAWNCGGKLAKRWTKRLSSYCLPGMFPGSGQPIWDKNPTYCGHALNIWTGVLCLHWPELQLLDSPLQIQPVWKQRWYPALVGLLHAWWLATCFCSSPSSAQANDCFIPSTAALIPANKGCLSREGTEQSLQVLQKYK